MLEAEVDEITCTVLVEPEGHLCKQDFLSLSEQINPLIKQFGTLNGVLVHAGKFSGWDGFAAFVVHLKFVNDHQKLVKKVAICTDSSVGNLVKSWLRIL